MEASDGIGKKIYKEWEIGESTKGYIVSFVRFGKRAYANDVAQAIEVDKL